MQGELSGQGTRQGSRLGRGRLLVFRADIPDLRHGNKQLHSVAVPDPEVVGSGRSLSWQVAGSEPTEKRQFHDWSHYGPDGLMGIRIS